MTRLSKPIKNEKEKTMKKLFILLTVLLSLGAVFAQKSQATTSEAIDQASNLGLESGKLQESIDNTQEAIEAKNPILEDAVKALEAANDALSALDNQDNDIALEALAAATGKLEVVIAAEPDLALAPVDLSIEIYDSGITTSKEANKILRLARVSLNDNDAITARLLLNSLASEIRIKTVYLPLASYPDAMLEAAALIKNNQPEEAKDVILTALNTLLITEEYLPLPVITAQALIEQAEKDITDGNLENADSNLDLAREQLKLARALGYSNVSYADLDDQLIELKRLLKSKEPHASALAKLREGINNLLHPKK